MQLGQLPDTPEENNINKSRSLWQQKDGILHKGVTSEGEMLLDEAFHAYNLECCLLSDNKVI